MELNVWERWHSATVEHQSLVEAKAATVEEFANIVETDKIASLGKKDKHGNRKQFMSIADPWLVAERKIGQSLHKQSEIGIEYADYVFTDPPYDAAIQYGELSALWNAWFYGESFNWTDYLETMQRWEVVNNSQQGKDFEGFSTGLYQNLRRVLDVMKPGAYMHLTFHSPSQKVRNAVIREAVHAGFIYEHIHYQEGPRLNPKGLLQPYGSAQGDYIFRFRKPNNFGHAMEYVDNGLRKQLRDKQSFDAIVVSTTKQLLAERGEPVPFTFIINHLDPVLNEHGFYLQYYGDWNVEDVLAQSNEFIMKEITIAGQAGRAWWFKDEAEALCTLRIPLTERVEKAVLSILKQHQAVSFTDALNEVYLKYPNSLTPDSASVMGVLSEYADKSKNLWVLSKKELEIENQHSQMIHHLAEIGAKLGFGICIGKRESGEKHMGVSLGSLTTGEPPWGALAKSETDCLRQVDCIWYSSSGIEYMFEVENTTQFTEAMIRSQCMESANRLFVVPDHRKAYIQRRLSNQLFNELIKRQGWRFMTYERLAKMAQHPPTKQQVFWDAAVIQLELDLAFDTGLAKPKKARRKRADSTQDLFEE